MSPSRIGLAVLACAAGGAALAAGSRPSLPAEPPPPGPAGTRPALPAPPSFRPPALSLHTYDSGLRLAVAEQPSAPLVELSAVLRCGSVLDPPDRPGLACATAELIADGGTTSRSGDEVSRAFESLGGSLEIVCSEDFVELRTTLLPTRVREGVALVAELLRSPRLAEQEWATTQRRLIAGLEQLDDDPESLAEDRFRRELFGNHGYAHRPEGTIAALAAMTAREIGEHHARRIGPRTVALVLAGPLHVDEMTALVTPMFTGWRSTAEPGWPGAVTHRARPGIVVIDRPGAPQARIVVGHLGVMRRSPEYPAARLLELVLGGGFGSRLIQELRERRGDAYDVSVEVVGRRARGPLWIHAGVRNAAVARSLVAIDRELRALHGAAPIELPELLRARRLLTARIIEAHESSEGLANLGVATLADDLPGDGWSRLLEEIQGLDPEAVALQAAEVIRPDERIAVVVGDARRLAPSIRRALPGVSVRVEKAGAQESTR